MRILLVNRCHFIDGGADRVYLNTGKLLVDNGHEVAYFSTIDNENLISLQSGYFVRKFQPRQANLYSKIKGIKNYLYNNEVYANLGDLIADFQPDVAHIHLYYGSLSSSVLTILKKKKVPIVTTIHDYRLLCPVNSMLDSKGQICESCKGGKFYNCLKKKCSDDSFLQSTVVTAEAFMRKLIYDPLVYIDHFIFVSGFSRNKHISFDYRYEHKSSLLHNFSGDNFFQKVQRGYYLLYFGRLSKEKGIITLINAVKATNTRLLIVGDGPLKEQIVNDINGINHIEYLGFKSSFELSVLISNSSFVVVPSEWYENNPMTIIESFLMGKPVIGSNIGGIPELINDKTGFIFDSANVESLCEAINHTDTVTAEEYDFLSRNCIAFANKHFDEKEHFKRLIEIYEKLANDIKK